MSTEKENNLAKINRERKEAKELQEKLANVQNLTPQEPEILKSPQETVSETATSEPSIPLSAVAKLVEEQVAKAMQGLNPQPVAQIVQAPPQAILHDVNDIEELIGFEMKDRQYVLCDNMRPISYSIAKQHTEHRSLQYTDKRTQTVHPLRYASNQISFFTEKQSKEPGSVLSTDIIFKNGVLNVPASNVLLQKFLAIHPDLNIVFKEHDPAEKSRNLIANKRISIEANSKAMAIGEVYNRAIASLVCVSYTPAWLYDDVMAEILTYIEKSPAEYLKYANDPSLKMRGVAKMALDTGDLVYSNYRFMNRNKEVLLEVGKNQDEFDEIVRYFETGQGRSFYEFLLHSSN